MVFGAILAGGIGKRIENYDIPKQFIEIEGTPIIVFAIKEFLKVEVMENIYIAIVEGWEDYLNKLLVHYFSEEQRQRIIVVKGGKERLDSFTNILDSIISKRGVCKEDILICHDSVRPFVRKSMIEDCITATMESGLALTVVPTTDTIHVAHDEQLIDSTLDRSGLYNGQNPAGFSVELLKNVIDNATDEEKKRITGTTQLMLSHGYKIRIVKGHTSNFKITTDNDLDVAESYLRGRRERNNIDLLDCTLRDGGIVIDFDFGSERIQKIKSVLENVGVQYIECGYVNEKKGALAGKTQYQSIQAVEQDMLSSGKSEGCTYVVMIDYGTYDFANLPERNADGVDGIRLAFHKENYKEAIECGKVIMAKGYDLYIQPMVCLRYSDDEYKMLIELCNNQLPKAKAFYIVDSFGQMDEDTLIKRMNLVDNFLSSTMKIGLHAHNNRQLAYSNSKAFIEHNILHDKMLDSSIMGMGKGAGNLCTELVVQDLNKFGADYNVEPLYTAIADYFAKQIAISPWGYCLEYYLSSVFSCTPSYIKIFTSNSKIKMDDLIELLKGIPEEKKAACDKDFANKHLEKYIEGMATL